MYIYEDIIWFIENTVLIFFFMRLACTYFLSKKYESIVVIRRSCSILARSHERICHPGKSNFSHVTGGLISATILVHVGETFIHRSDFTEWQKWRTFQGLLRSIDSLSWWSLIVLSSFGGPYDKPWSYGPKNMTTRNNICIKALLLTSVYSIVKLLFTSIGSVAYALYAVLC